MHTRTLLLALLLATCTAVPVQALDVHIANKSKSEILSVFLAGLTDDRSEEHTSELQSP